MMSSRLFSMVTSPAAAVAKYCDEYVCLHVCLSAGISLESHTRSLTNFLGMLPMSMAQYSSGMLMIRRIAYRQEGGDGSAQHGWSVIYDCLVLSVFWHCWLDNTKWRSLQKPASIIPKDAYLATWLIIGHYRPSKHRKSFTLTKFDDICRLLLYIYFRLWTTYCSSKSGKQISVSR